MNYRQLNAEERSALAALRTMELSRTEFARQLASQPSLAQCILECGRHQCLQPI